MKTTVEIPDALFHQAKKYASAHGLTFREVIETSLRRTLDEKPSRKKPFRLRNGSFKGTGMAPGLDWPAIRELIYEGRGG
ncbi:MAG TPA: hypothetical protein VJN43_23530 [Bryobacteraceae bacterium]|nr:hypothetical protein [Bryobacteraceae bacterium]